MSLDNWFQKNPGMKERIEKGRKILEAQKHSEDSDRIWTEARGALPASIR